MCSTRRRSCPNSPSKTNVRWTTIHTSLSNQCACTRAGRILSRNSCLLVRPDPLDLNSVADAYTPWKKHYIPGQWLMDQLGIQKAVGPSSHAGIVTSSVVTIGSSRAPSLSMVYDSTSSTVADPPAPISVSVGGHDLRFHLELPQNPYVQPGPFPSFWSLRRSGLPRLFVSAPCW